VHIRLIAVGERQPAWVDDAFTVYTKRFPSAWKFRLDTIATARRGKNEAPQQARDAESRSLLSRLKPGELVVLLDERGKQLTSRQLAEQLQTWQAGGRDLCFIVGGPDGVSYACRDRARVTWSLSKLTLPHGLARVMFAEALYRAWSLQSGHPYHRK
jgi:23S rRNA (pseudouridine1915-N3)-methyltransferase